MIVKYLNYYNYNLFQNKYNIQLDVPTNDEVNKVWEIEIK